MARNQKLLVRKPGLSSQPENKYFLNECFARLVEKYKIGVLKSRKHSDTFRFMKMEQASYWRILRKKIIVTAANKAKIFLAFQDTEFAPRNDNERGICKSLESSIPKPLSYAKVIDEGSTLNLGNIVALLLGDSEFVSRVAEQVAGIAGNKTDSERPARKRSRGKAVISAEFVEETKELFERASDRIDSIIALGDSQRQRVQEELEEMLKKLEIQFGNLFLRVRALKKTATGQAALRILEQEATFIREFNRGDKKLDGGENE